MPSSLTTVLPIALVFSTRPPELVWGTGTVPTNYDAFLGSMGSVTSPEAARYRVSGYDEARICLVLSLPACPQDNQRLGSPTLLRPAFAALLGSVGSPEGSPLVPRLGIGRGHGGTGISTGCASTTPFGLALAPDSPWED